MPRSQVFVYGTLMTGLSNYRVVAPYAVAAQPATIQGCLYHLPAGYPAVISGLGVVHGELITLTNLKQALKALDHLEDYHGPGQDNLYNRVLVDVTLEHGQTQAYTYLWPEERRPYLKKRGTFIKNGNWKHYINNKRQS